MPVASSLHAWVDESMQLADGAGHYLLAAAVIDPAVADDIRHELRRLLPGRARRLHWRDEGERRRRILASAVASLDAVHLVAIGTPVDPRRQERARRLCLERLLFELQTLGVTSVRLERRTAALDARDVELIDALRARGTVGPDVAVTTALPEREPLLWLSDIVAGAIGLARRGGDPDPYRALSSRITEHEVVLS